jgi:hypothetical protein
MTRPTEPVFGVCGTVVVVMAQARWKVDCYAIPVFFQTDAFFNKGSKKFLHVF